LGKEFEDFGLQGTKTIKSTIFCIFLLITPELKRKILGNDGRKGGIMKEKLLDVMKWTLILVIAGLVTLILIIAGSSYL